MGFGMEGMEERILTIARAICAKFDPVTYVEIGVGEGPTLTAIAATLKESGRQWRAVGIELPNGYSFSRQKTTDFATHRNLKLDFVVPNGNVQRPAWNQVTVFLKDSQSFLTELWQEPIHLALIDGCHGKPCATLDFLALEVWVAKGGIVMFHDFGADQTGHYQPHCITGLDVRGAVQDLGLLSGKRAGWVFREEMTANRMAGGWDMGVFQKEK